MPSIGRADGATFETAVPWHWAAANAKRAKLAACASKERHLPKHPSAPKTLPPPFLVDKHSI